MPKTSKDVLKRKIAQAMNNIDKAGSDISEVETAFRQVADNLANDEQNAIDYDGDKVETPHEMLADGLQAALALLVSTQEVINEFARISWGMDNPDWQVWRE
jgi:hypothetical protein